jgi:hypothetical protein
MELVMHWLAPVMAVVLALAIIAIGTQYILSPRTAARSFGLPLPENGTNIPWWIRLKGVRDVASGLTILALLIWGTTRGVGIVLLALAVIPVGDMLLVLAAKGSARNGFVIHAITAVVIALTAVSLIVGVP